MACPTFQIHHRGPGSSPPGQAPLPPVGGRVGFSFPATVGFVAVSPPSCRLVPNHYSTLGLVCEFEGRAHLDFQAEGCAVPTCQAQL